MLANDDTLGGARCIPHVMSYRHVDSEVSCPRVSEDHIFKSKQIYSTI